MVLRTDCYRNLEEDLATVLDTVEMYIYEQIFDFDKKYIVANGPGSDWDAFYDEIDRFIEENADLELVDEVYVYHLSRMFREEEQLIPLKQLLVEESDLSCFLKKHDIHFLVGSDDNIEFYYKNKFVTPEMILSSGHHNLLAKRLGYLGEADFCINGFAFWPDIQKTSDGYFDYLKRSPEIILNLDDYLGTNMWKEFQKETQYYGVVFKVPIEEVIFDGKDLSLTNDVKVKLLLKYALRTMHGCYYQCASSDNNPIIRLTDSETVKIDHFIKIED
ncbi:MAG: hypothetical protein IKS48_13470 [Eubacterium sp.]|nr:hypothetical protein [Eubacterium sp.]